MTESRVGGTESNHRYLAIFLTGIVLGSVIRLVAYLFPQQIVKKIEEMLLGDLK